MDSNPRHPIFGTPIVDGWSLETVEEIRSTEKHSCVAGPFGSDIASKYFVDSGVPVIRGSNLTADLIPFVPAGFVFVSDERAEKYRAQHVRGGDLVFTCWGTIGQVGLIPMLGPFTEYIISNKQLKLRPDPARVDSRFLYYYFAGPAAIEFIRNRAIGSAVPGINLGILKSLPVVLPKLDVQRHIADILSAYDELIENNSRRIKILEEMAQAIYREWFVDFRYPGHETVSLVDSPLGPIPNGWRIRQLVDLVTTQYGYTESTSIVPVGPKFLRGMDINKTSFIDWDAVPYCPINDSDFAKFALARGDVLVIRMADPGKIGFVEQDVEAVFASYLVRIRPINAQTLDPHFLFYYANSDSYQAFVTGASTGTTRKSISAQVMTATELPVPPLTIQIAFRESVAPIRELMANLVRSSANLRQTRDLLLPRLISGEIDVSGLELLVPAEPTA